MFDSDSIITKAVQTPEACTEFQLRWLADKGVGVLSDREDHHWFLLDSGDHWYDVTQDRYPPKQKCRCKNDWFTLKLDYLPRLGTGDFREISPRLSCTACGREKRLTPIELDYSPTIQLLERPISPLSGPQDQIQDLHPPGLLVKRAASRHRRLLPGAGPAPLPVAL